MVERQDGPLNVVVVGGGIAGAEALLALHGLAGDRVSLTLLSPTEDLVLPALSVAESFALGHVPRYPWADLLQRVNADRVRGALGRVDMAQREIVLDDGPRMGFDALVIATGARAVARVEHATTWWPGGSLDEFGGLLRDLEEGYTKRVAFVIPAGAVWPLPLYELALMTAREVAGMGIDDAQLTVVTPEPVPLALFGRAAADALRQELERAGIALETAAVARVERSPQLAVVLQPTIRRLEVDRVVALPGVDGPRIPGTTQNEAGFILVERHGRMRDSDAVWAAGDAIAYPVKFGGLASQQADAVAADIAARAGAGAPQASSELELRGVLMTGGAPRERAPDDSPQAHRRRAIWRPEDKVLGRFLSPYLESVREPSAGDDDASRGVVVHATLPGPEHGEDPTFEALWGPGSGSNAEHLQRLGRAIHDYEAKHEG